MSPALLLLLAVQDPGPILDRASAAYQTVTTLSAEFVQVIANPLLGAPDTTRGKLYQMRPSRFAMRFAQPGAIASWPTAATSGCTRPARRRAR